MTGNAAEIPVDGSLRNASFDRLASLSRHWAWTDEAMARFEQELPDLYNGFLYVLEGAVSVGDERTQLTAGQVGWLAEGQPNAASVSSVRITGEEKGARLILYAGERQGIPVMMHGPFVGESRADLMRLSRQYLDGKMPRMSELAMEAASGNRN